MRHLALGPRGSVRAGRLLAGAVVLGGVLGLLAMHGLQIHGTDHVQSSGVFPSTVEIDDYQAGPPSGEPDRAGTTGAAEASGNGGHTGAVVGLCLAALGGAVLSLIAHRWSTSGRWPVPRPPRIAKAAYRVRGRLPDPPTLVWLCVRRC